MVNLAAWAHLCRGAWLACVTAIGVASACGGTAVVGAPGGAAGATSAAGASLAGANSAGGAAGSGAAGAAGSAADAACNAAQDPGQCEAYVPSFWHDPNTGLCEPFIYGGCGGNANRYPSRDACLHACPKITDDFGECVNDSNCAFVSAGCCAECEPVAIERLVAINVAHVPMYGSSHCPITPPCAPCQAVLENEQNQKYFKPECQNSRCTLVDIRETALTACEKTSDCMLRDGAGCCPECDGAGWVALNKTADLCDGVPTACDDCISPLPQEWDVVCLSGRCRQEGPL
ncbi:MAG TPA: BPTI/Kunitz domain-containing protein [Polyangiaceae bacterium]|nr:BPTI/Kunitz domain-containing protein [Polyangiaceae bacterium]